MRTLTTLESINNHKKRNLRCSRIVCHGDRWKKPNSIEQFRFRRVYKFDRCSKLHDITLATTKAHVMLRNHATLTWMRDKQRASQHVTLWNNTKSTLQEWQDSWWCIWVCGLNPLMVCFNAKTCDIWEGNVTIRRETSNKNIRSLELWDIRQEWH